MDGFYCFNSEMVFVKKNKKKMFSNKILIF